jgi:hypothetical protein
MDVIDSPVTMGPAKKEAVVLMLITMDTVLINT